MTFVTFDNNCNHVTKICPIECATSFSVNPTTDFYIIIACTGSTLKVKMASEDLTATFVSIGLSEQKAKETVKNEQLSSSLKQAIEQVYDTLVSLIILQISD